MDAAADESVLLDVGDAEWLALAAAADFDEDAALETNLEELTGLVETEITVGVAADSDPAYLWTIEWTDYRTPPA